MKYSKKKKISILLVGGAITILALRFYYGWSWAAAALTAVVADCILILSFVFEKKSDDKHRQLVNDIENGEYNSSDQWREEYDIFLKEKGFEKVRRSSMKADLSKRYRRYFGIFFILFGALLILFGAAFTSGGDDGAGVFIMIVGILIVIYGFFGLFPKNVRSFIKKCGADLDAINASYMDGKLLTYKKLYSDEHRNGGINIGSEYTVIFNVKEIAAVKNSDIVSAQHRILRTKYYGNSVYTGTKYTHHIDVTVKNPLSGNIRTFTAELDRFQAELAQEELSRYCASSTQSLCGDDLNEVLATDDRDKNYNV